jgi:hypothetical protein
MQSQIVTALAWRPLDTEILAFGTRDGRIGITDTINEGSGLFAAYVWMVRNL